MSIVIDWQGGPDAKPLGSGAETSVNTLATMLLELDGKPSVGIKYAPPRRGEVKYSHVSRAQAVLGFEPRVTLAVDLERTWHWSESQTIQATCPEEEGEWHANE